MTILASQNLQIEFIYEPEPLSPWEYFYPTRFTRPNETTNLRLKSFVSKTVSEDPQYLHNKWLCLHHAIWWNEAPTYDPHHSEYVLIQIVHNLEEDCTKIHISKRVPITQFHDLPPHDSKDPSRVGTPAGRASTPVTLPERIGLINGHYYLWQEGPRGGSGVKVYWIYSGKTDEHRWAYFAKNNKTILLNEGILDGSLPLTIPYDPRNLVEGDTIEIKNPAPEEMPAGSSNMSSTRTETKIETKTETQKGKRRVPPGGDEPSRPGTPPNDPDGSDGSQGSDDGRGSDSWRSASVKEPPSFKKRGRKLDVFTGKREKVDDFLMDFGRYLRLNKAIYPKDDYVNKNFAEWRWKTWGDLRHRLREDFEPHDREGTAERKLDSIRQTGDLADIDEFNKAFNELAGDSEHNDAGLKLFYKQGINPALKATINKFEVVPTTLDGWQKAAVRKYNDWVRSKAEEKAWGRCPKALDARTSDTETTAAEVD
ncbi:hypothetical protein PQX77_020836 [Marasmius sp. AFHP31]|nr:hypothetical protein PQX77_020836 [Marasmius sp. AFHP31]